MERTIDSNKISFSILMANYNNEKYIKQAIKSVLSQTYPYWELIIVDDCSTDKSINIIKGFLNDKRIRLICHNENLGCGATQKTAIENANNEVIAILDSDDALHKTALEIMAKTYKKHTDIGFIYSTMWRCDEDLNIYKIDNTIREVDVNKSHWLINPPISHLKTFKKRSYQQTRGFEIKQKRSVDRDIIYKLSEVTNFKFIDIPLYYYREHSSGICQGNNRFTTKFYSYMAKYKTYRRRKNKNLPNFNYFHLKFMYYYNMVFYRGFKFVINFFLRLRLNILLQIFLDSLPNIGLKFKLIEFKSNYIDIFK